MQQRYIIFQAYGNEGILQECRFALLQLMKHNDTGAFCVVVYTDNKDFFSPVLQQFKQHEIIELVPEIIQQWKGAVDFVHRVKIEMLIRFVETHQGAFLYFDTDTYCKTSISPILDAIEKGSLFMHTYEGNLADRANIVFKKWKHFLNTTNINYKGNVITDIDQIQMWNAGVLGFSDQYLPQLREVLKLTDNIYPKFPKHTVEQFAFSYVFQHTAAIKGADQIIYHYWDLKEYRQLLTSFFNKHHSVPFMQQLQLIPVKPEQAFDDKMKYKKMFFLKKLFSKKWSIQNYYLDNISAIKP